MEWLLFVAIAFIALGMSGKKDHEQRVPTSTTTSFLMIVLIIAGILFLLAMASGNSTITLRPPGS